MLRKILIAIFAIVLLVVAFLLKTFSDAGEFKTISPHFDGTKTLIPDAIGAEDITIDHVHQLAYISMDDRFATLHGKEGHGGICFLDLKNPNASLSCEPGMSSFPFAIHPHGISVYVSPDTISGFPYLFVINHADGKHSILTFRDARYRVSGESALKLGKIFEDSVFMISPNDVLAVDENRFYFTNDHGSRTPLGIKLETYLQLKKSNVVYYDGEKYSIVADGIAYANGINMSHDGKEVYVSSTIGGCVLVYDRDAASGKLTLKNKIMLGSGADNIELDEAGNLWVACHPKLLTFVQHSNDTSKLAPSQVFKITRDTQGNFKPEEIFLSKGDDLSASSVAAVSGKTMLIGSVMDKGILRCEMK